jgi:DNA polymerase III delta subunit
MAIQIFYGEDTFRAKKEIEKIIDSERQKSPVNFAYFSEDSDSEDIESKIFDFFEKPSLFGERKIAFSRLKFWRGSFPKVGENEIFLLLIDKLPKNMPKDAEVKYFPFLEGKELIRWIKKCAKDLGISISERLCWTLYEIYGSDTQIIWNELFTLSCKEPSGKIDIEDFIEVRGKIIGIKNFELIDAILSKRNAEALYILHKSIILGIPALPIISNIISHIRAMLIVKSGKIPSGHPYWISKVKQFSKKFTEEELKSMFKRLLILEYGIKTGKYDPEIVLEAFLIGIY